MPHLRRTVLLRRTDQADAANIVDAVLRFFRPIKSPDVDDLTREQIPSVWGQRKGSLVSPLHHIPVGSGRNNENVSNFYRLEILLTVSKQSLGPSTFVLAISQLD